MLTCLASIFLLYFYQSQSHRHRHHVKRCTQMTGKEGRPNTRTCRFYHCVKMSNLGAGSKGGALCGVGIKAAKWGLASSGVVALEYDTIDIHTFLDQSSTGMIFNSPRFRSNDFSH